jgi:hypothetical protein
VIRVLKRMKEDNKRHFEKVQALPMAYLLQLEEKSSCLKSTTSICDRVSRCTRIAHILQQANMSSLRILIFCACAGSLP